MSGILLDAELRNKLGDLSQEREVYDESGKVVARFVPVSDKPYEPHFSKEDLDRTVREASRWYSSDEVFTMLRNLEAEHG